jgi:hypothetical protein
MLYKVLADLTVLTHFLWILFLIFGGIWGRKYKAVKVVHIGGLAFAFVINVFGFYCPLTDLEIWLESKSSPATTYSGSFISHYLDKIIYLNVSDVAIAAMTVGLCGFNAWLYLRQRRQKRTDGTI